MLRTSASARFGLWLFAGVLALSALLGSQLVTRNSQLATRNANAQTGTHTLTVPNATPQITALTLNNASSLILIVNTTTAITVSFTISDDNGCRDVIQNGAVTTTLYREGVSTTCAVAYPALSNRNYLNCYVVSTTTHNCVSTSTSAQATTTFNVWYFAEATDASSSFSAQNWLAAVYVRDASSTTNSTTSATGQELLTLLGIALNSSTIGYGTLPAGTDTGATNTISTVQNAGNSSTSLQVNGNAMCAGGTCIATTSQHYSSGTFQYGVSDNQLQQTATDVGGFSVPRPPLTYWVDTTYLPSSSGNNGAVINSGYIYLVGGSTGSNYTSTVLYAPIGSTGTLGAWTETTKLPSSTGGHSVVVNNGYIYKIGGYRGSSYTSTVLFAPIGTTGTIGSWVETTPLLGARALAPAVVSNNFLYVFGGEGSVYTSSVLYAPIGSTGTLGDWVTTTPLPNTSARNPAVVRNSYVYVIGGSTSTNYTSTVLYAPIGSTGTLGAWATTARLPGAIAYHSGVLNNDFIYVLGGYNGSSYTSTVLYSPVGSTGTLGDWAMTTALPGGRAFHSAAISNGYIYTMGGSNGTTYVSTTFYTSLASRNLFWGFGSASGTAAGSYSSTVTYTAVYQP